MGLPPLPGDDETYNHDVGDRVSRRASVFRVRRSATKLEGAALTMQRFSASQERQEDSSCFSTPLSRTLNSLLPFCLAWQSDGWLTLVMKSLDLPRGPPVRALDVAHFRLKNRFFEEVYSKPPPFTHIP